MVLVLVLAIALVAGISYLAFRPSPEPARALESGTSNGLYAMAPVPAPCAESESESLTGLVGCARSVHLGALRELGNQAEPAVSGFTGVIETPCGNSVGAAGLYCPIDSTIYIETSRPGDVQLSVLHEFGHHLQQVAGILPASYRMDLPRGEANRRRELQAVCFSSMGLANARLWSQTSAHDWETRYAGRPGSSNTASGDSVVRWLRTGATASSYGQCNTWTASAAEVS